MSQQGSDQNNPENSGERPPIRPISLRPGESSGGLAASSGPLPAPLKLQPLGRPGPGQPQTPPVPLGRPTAQTPPAPGGPPAPGRPAGPPPAGGFTPGLTSQGHSPPPAAPGSSGLTPASATPSRIEFQQLELKGVKAPGAAPGGPPGVSIPPRPVNHKSAERPPEDPSGVVPRDWPPRKVDLTDGPTGTVPVDQTAPAPRFLPGPEASARGRGSSGAIRPPEGARAPLGPPPDLEETSGRGGMDTDSKASWGEGGGNPTTPAGTKLPRPRPQRAPMGKGPVILVTAFAAVLLAVVIWPPKKGAAPVATISESATPDAPVAAITPEASASPEPDKSPLAANLPSETPEPLFTSTPEPAESPKGTPKPVATETPKPKPPVTPKPKPTAKPMAAATPKPKPAETPKPVAVAPKPIEEEPPARNNQPTCSVRVSVVPADVDAKVYLVNDADRYTDHSAGSVRLQQIKKGSYTLKIVANGYETFTKKMDVSKDHNLSVRLERIPPPQPAYQPPAPAPSYNPAPYNPPAPAPYYPPPAPAPSGGSYQIQAPGI